MADRKENSRADEAPGESCDTLLRAAAHVPLELTRTLRAPIWTRRSLAAGRLRMRRRIGEGGMGLVFAAYDTQRRASVAVKTLSRLDPGGLYQLKNEFRSLAEVSHPNLVQLYELFGEGDQWFFTMELVSGEHFDRWVRPAAGTLDEARLRAALPQLLAAITAIHAAGKLHRDLKPRNVLVTRDGRVVVLDFGLAVDPEPGGVGQTLENEGICGTAAYMAPEQAAGLGATSASDFYALGVMLFEALTGVLPFQGRALEMLVDKQLAAAPNLRATQPQLPADLSELCDALLAREPERRPGARELQALLGTPAAHSGLFRTHERESLLGRESELAQLTAAYEVAASGTPQLVSVSGESGMGKSALLAQFLAALQTDSEVVVLAGRCYERESVPFKGVDSVVDTLSRWLRKLPATVAPLLMPREVYALGRIFPVLGRIEAVAAAPTRDIPDPQELQRRAFAAFCELLGRIRDRWPVVLVIDDAQWLDADAARLLGFLLTDNDPSPTLMILCHRSEAVATHHALQRVYELVERSTGWQRLLLNVEPLAREPSEQLARRVLGPAARPALVTQLAVESGGSPFFIGELARQLRASGATHLSLSEAVLAHVAGLGPGARRLLEVLATAGRPLELRLALDAAAADHRTVDLLQSERLLRAADSGDRRSLECYHDKIREIVVQALPSSRLRALHAVLLAALLERDDSDPEHLAVHALAAGDREAAAHYTERAADAAAAAMAFERAAQLYLQALELGKPELGVKRGDALAYAGRGADAASAYLAAVSVADPVQALELRRRAAEQLLISGHIDAGRSLLDGVLSDQGLSLPRTRSAALCALIAERARLRLRGLALRTPKAGPSADTLRELAVLWSAARGLAGVDGLTGAALSSRYARMALDSGSLEHAARALGSEAWFASTVQGERAKARVAELLVRAQALAEASGQPEARAWVQLNRALTWFMQADFVGCASDCAQVLETLRDNCKDVAFEVCTAHVFEQLGSWLAGTLPPSADLAALVDDAFRRGDLRAAILLCSSGAQARLVRGDAAELQRHLAEVNRLWRRPKSYGWLDLNLLMAELSCAMYAGDFERGLSRVESDWSALEASKLMAVPLREVFLRMMRGSFARSLARTAGADSLALRTLAARDARALRRIRSPLAAAAGRCLEAALALDRGEIERAIAPVIEALHMFEKGGYVLTGHALRRRVGQLQGGTQGASLVAQADSALLRVGASDLEASTRLLVCGL